MNKLIENFFKSIDDKTITLTPNHRLSATLHKLYAQYKIAKNETTWITPIFLPVNNWIEQLWLTYTQSEFSTFPILLTSIQENFIWEDILSKSKESECLLQVNETAHIAKAAKNLISQWRLSLSHPAFQVGDYAIFCQWAREFQLYCAERNVIDTSSLPQKIIEALKDKKITPPSIIFLFGFTEMSPQLIYLFSVCESLGSHTQHINFSTHQGTYQRVTCKNMDEEILAMARFAKSIYLKIPQATIACVIPSLEQNCDRVQQIFSGVFSEENSISFGEVIFPFNISAGKTLLQYPILNTALQILALGKTHMTIEVFGHLLTSPFMGEGEKERSARAQYDSFLRQKNIARLSLHLFLQDPKNKLLERCPHFANRINNFRKFIAGLPQKNSYSTWASTFNHLLSIMGWPGERSLNSNECQTVDNWLTILNELMSFDYFSTPVTFNEALHTLNKIITKKIFQPKSPETPIQVLGLLEAAGLPFDYLWVIGMDDMTWPSQPNPNPFIPKNLQRELQMPHATSEHELIYSQQIIKQFKDNAHQVIFSFAEKKEKMDCQVSALIRDLAEITLDKLDLFPYQPQSEQISQSRAMEYILDENAPPIINKNGTATIKGGVNVIKQQSLCPFKAFAEWRLSARALETPLPGLRPEERGTILHKALELIWRKIKDHFTLMALPEENLSLLIRESIQETFNQVNHSREDSPQFILLEKKRLYQLLFKWMQLEKQREPFKVIKVEATTQLDLPLLNLSLKIDRIDELMDGNYLVIDYKSAKNLEISYLLSERPQEPQLLLYSLLHPEKTIGVTFAQISPGETCFKGISQVDLQIKGIKPFNDIKKISAIAWLHQLTQWQEIINKLGAQFVQGYAKVHPKDKQTCEWCAQKPLCRVQEIISC